MSRLSRRGMMGSVAALIPATAGAVPAAAASAPAIPDSDADLLALCQEFHRLNHIAYVMPDKASPTWGQARAERQDVLDALHPMRPATVAGRVAKAGVAAMVMEDTRDRWAVTGTDAFVLDTLRAVAGMPQLVRGDVGDPDQVLVDACAEFVGVEAEVSRTGRTDAEHEATAEWAHTQQAPLLDVILATPCTTLVGLQAIVRAWAAWDAELLRDGAGDTGECLAAKVAETVLALRGVA